MYAFNYHRPSSLQEALSLLRDADDGKFMAGGQTLIPTMKQRLAMPSDVVDLGAVQDLVGICPDGDDVVVVGGMTKHAAVADSDLVKSKIPALAELAEAIGDPQVRNRGTLGGSIANNDPASDYPGAVLGLGATVSTDRRKIAADDFFTGMFETALEEDELITHVSFPVPAKAKYMKFPNPASRYSMAGSFVARTDGGVRVAITGAGPCVFRWREAEQALGGNFGPTALDGLTMPADDLNGDIHGSPEYRANLVKVMTKRAVEALA
jgi:carbon-monoxide dehydrogenase medium subunit